MNATAKSWTTLASVFAQERVWEQDLVQTHKMVHRDSEEVAIRDNQCNKAFTYDEVLALLDNTMVLE